MTDSLFDPPAQDVQDFKFAEGRSAEDIPFQFIENHLFINVNLKEEETLRILDTGAGMSVIDADYARKIGPRSKGSMKGDAVVNTTDVSFITLPPFRINGIRFKEQKIACVRFSQLLKEAYGLDVAGVLGYDFLSRFVTRIDYAGEKISFYSPDAFTYSGDGKIIELGALTLHV